MLAKHSSTLKEIFSKGISFCPSTLIFASYSKTNFSFFCLNGSLSMIYDSQLIIEVMQQKTRKG